MWWKKILFLTSLIAFLFSGNFGFADCPSTDFTGDCFVNFKDFAFLAGQWLTGSDWDDLSIMVDQWLSADSNMVYILNGEFDMGDHHGDGHVDEQPVHTVFLDSFFISRYEVTNQQYCDYLNWAYDACDIKVENGIVYALSDGSNSYPYCDMHSIDVNSQIDYSGGVFSVRTKGGRDMSNDPMVYVGWHGAAAYCNWRSGQEGYQKLYDPCDPNWPCDFSKKGYRLPTEAEWEYAARGGQHSPYYRFPWGDTISHSQANYRADPTIYPYDVNPTGGNHPDWSDGIAPYTAPVGSFLLNGYSLYDMAGNVFEWCNDWYDFEYYSTSPYDNPRGPVSGQNHVFRGGSWTDYAYYSRVAFRYNPFPDARSSIVGFRVVLDF